MGGTEVAITENAITGAGCRFQAALKVARPHWHCADGDETRIYKRNYLGEDWRGFVSFSRHVYAVCLPRYHVMYLFPNQPPSQARLVLQII